MSTSVEDTLADYRDLFVELVRLFVNRLASIADYQGDKIVNSCSCEYRDADQDIQSPTTVVNHFSSSNEHSLSFPSFLSLCSAILRNAYSTYNTSRQAQARQDLINDLLESVKECTPFVRNIFFSAVSMICSNGICSILFPAITPLKSSSSSKYLFSKWKNFTENSILLHVTIQNQGKLPSTVNESRYTSCEYDQILVGALIHKNFDSKTNHVQSQTPHIGQYLPEELSETFEFFLLKFGVIFNLLYYIRKFNSSLSAKSTFKANSGFSEIFLQLFMILLMPTCTYSAPAEIIRGPNSTNESIANVEAIFHCYAMAELVSFLVNGTEANKNFIEELGFMQGMVESDGLVNHRSLTVQLSFAISNTEIECQATNIFTDPSQRTSPPALLLVQGELDSPSSTKVRIFNETTVFVSWMAPPTLYGTAISYFLSSINSSMNETLLTTDNSTNFTFISPDPCFSTGIRITPFNGVYGKSAVIGFYMPSKPVDKEIPVRYELESTSNFLLKINVSGLCLGEYPSSIRVAVTSSISQSINMIRLNSSTTANILIAELQLPANDSYNVMVKFANTLGFFDVSINFEILDMPFVSSMLPHSSSLSSRYYQVLPSSLLTVSPTMTPTNEFETEFGTVTLRIVLVVLCIPMLVSIIIIAFLICLIHRKRKKVKPNSIAAKNQVFSKTSHNEDQQPQPESERESPPAIPEQKFNPQGEMLPEISSLSGTQVFQSGDNNSSQSHNQSVSQDLNLFNIFRLLRNKTAHWDDIGRELGVELNDRDNLRSDFCLNDSGCLERVINIWLESDQRSWDQLITAMRNLQYKDILYRIDEQHLLPDGQYSENCSQTDSSDSLCKSGSSIPQTDGDVLNPEKGVDL